MEGNSCGLICNVVSKIFQTDAVKIIKLTIRPIGRHYPRSSSLPHVDTGPTVSSIFGTLPGSPFLSDCQALSVIRPVSPQWYQTGVLSASISFLEIRRSHRVPNREYGGWGMTAILFFSSVQFSSVQTLTHCCFWSLVRILGTNLAATRMPNSSVRTHWHVP